MTDYWERKDLAERDPGRAGRAGKNLDALTVHDAGAHRSVPRRRQSVHRPAGAPARAQARHARAGRRRRPRRPGAHAGRGVRLSRHRRRSDHLLRARRPDAHRASPPGRPRHAIRSATRWSCPSRPAPSTRCGPRTAAWTSRTRRGSTPASIGCCGPAAASPCRSPWPARCSPPVYPLMWAREPSGKLSRHAGRAAGAHRARRLHACAYGRTSQAEFGRAADRARRFPRTGAAGHHGRRARRHHPRQSPQSRGRPHRLVQAILERR